MLDSTAHRDLYSLRQVVTREFRGPVGRHWVGRKRAWIERLQAQRINSRNRIPADVRISIDPTIQSNGIALSVAPCDWVVPIAVIVVVQLCLGVVAVDTDSVNSLWSFWPLYRGSPRTIVHNQARKRPTR